LGVHGVKTLVVEKNERLEGEPRAVTLDDESLRTLQGAGLSQAVLGEVVLGYGVRYFAWNGKPLAAIQPTRQEYGYPKRNAFRQPRLVQTLGQGLQRFDHVDVRFGHELLSIAEDAQGARSALRHGDRQVTVAAKWVVACDGGRSKVRDLLGVKLDGDTYPERWLIVDLADRTVPLRHTSTYCDPRRPAIRLPGPQGALRYEFMLRGEDRDEDVLQESVFRQWIRDRVPEDAALPLVRKAVYGFHARVATRWKQGRVLLAGDAAHLTPPFAGQGLNSGIRDAANLGWKLAAVLRWGAGPELLDSYETERRPHAAALIRMALRIGAFMQPKTIPGAVLAQTALRALCLIPRCRDYILQLRFKPKPQLQGGAFEPSGTHRRSELIPQPEVELRGGRIERLDTVLGDGFAVLGWDGPAFRAAAQALLPAGAPGRAVALLRAEDDFLGNEPAAGVTRVRDITGELGNALDALGAVAIVIRPDRYWARLLDAPALGRSVDAARPGVAHSPSVVARAAVIAAGLALAAGGAAQAQAQTQTQTAAFPSKPVRLITPFAAGSGPDVALRVAAERLSRKWSQPVIVDNKPGGNGFIAIAALRQGAPDGHELVQLDSNHLTTHPHTFGKLPYDPQKDLEPVRPLFRNNFFVTVAKDSPYKTLDDIVAAARAQPGQVTYGSWFNGSPGHLGALRLQKLKKIEMLHVPYKEMNQLYTAVATREVSWALGSAASAGALEKAGKLRFIAIAGPQRSRAYPDVPSVDETPSTKGYEVASWTGLFAPKGTPQALREKISADLKEALAAPEVQARYRGFDYEAFDAGPDAFAELIRRETAGWGDIIKAANLKLD
jgi:3-(3-hydroxy-phenyl)propionate hydroxylase